MGYRIPDRKAVANVRYNVRRFIKACDHLPPDVVADLHAAVLPLFHLCAERERSDQCSQND